MTKKTTPLATFTPEEALAYHEKNRGKLEVLAKTPLENFKDLSLAYTPGVAEVCKAIQQDENNFYKYTNVSNTVAVVTDGSAILGLGNIGSKAGHPVMEGKCVLFKMLAGVDAFPIALDTQNTEEIIETVTHIAPSFGGINLEDLAAPHCFDVERALKEKLDIPVFHDDQHGTAIVTLAGLLNALKVVGKKIQDVKVVFSGAGAGGMACAKFYLSVGVRDVILCDSKGAIYLGRKEGMNSYKEEIAQSTNKEQCEGTLADALKGADVFVGLSAPNIVTQAMIKSMQTDSIVFAAANPRPEIMPEDAKAAGAKIVATGRSDYPNQINNVLGFPGIFRGALDVHATDINEEMKLAAAHAIADLIPDHELTEEYIITNPLDPRVMPAEAAAVAQAAMKTKVARLTVKPETIKEQTAEIVRLNQERVHTWLKKNTNLSLQKNQK